MKEKVANLEKRIKNYISQTHITSNIVFKNSGIIWRFVNIIYNNLIDIKIHEIDYLLSTKVTLNENIKLIQNFYNKNNINLNVDELINKGIIDLEIFQQYADPFVYGWGLSNYKDGVHKSIECTDTGYIYDSIILVHELSHYHNQPDDERREINDFLTESIAMIEELIYNEYLKELGYIYDNEAFKNNYFVHMKEYAKECATIFKFCYFYNTFSNISLNNYEILFDEDNYEKDITDIERMINEHSIDIVIRGWYIVGFALSVYMYIQYKKDKSFMNNIQILHELINEEDLFKCLKSIGLNDLGENDQEKISIAFHKLKKELHIDSKIIKK